LAVLPRRFIGSVAGQVVRYAYRAGLGCSQPFAVRLVPQHRRVVPKEKAQMSSAVRLDRCATSAYKVEFVMLGSRKIRAVLRKFRQAQH
jgi:hypothetical protein